jgi:hypothetical protein
MAQHRKNLDRLEEKKAMYGLDAPLAILNAIDREEEEVARIEAVLAGHAPPMAEQVDPVWQTQRDFIRRATHAYADSIRARRGQPSAPYKFLFSFQMSDAEIFHGRQAAIETLLRRVQGEDERHRLTVLHAPSGAGKTSLLNAGLSPRLLAIGDLPLYARTYNDPVGQVKKAIVDTVGEVGPDLGDLSLHAFLKTAAGALSEQTTLVLYLDQFEEFFLYLNEEAQEEVVHDIAACYYDYSLPVKFLLSLRADYFSDLSRFETAIRTLFYNHFRLEPMTPAEARQAIVAPAQTFGVSYEPALVDRLLDDLEQAEMSPPQLQILCDRLYSERQDQAITLALYESQGGAQGILQGYLAEVLSRLPGRMQTLAKDVLIELVSSQQTRLPLGKETLLTRTQADSQQLENTLNRLLDARLIERVVIGEVEQYELTHEHLIAEIANWIGRDQLLVKQMRELLRHRLEGYRHYDLLLDERTLETIRPHLPILGGLSSEEIDMIYHSALVADYEVAHWLELMPPGTMAETVRRILDKLLAYYLKVGGSLPASFPMNATTLDVIREYVPDLGTLPAEAMELILYSALVRDHQTADWLARVDDRLKSKVLAAGLDSLTTDLQIRALKLVRQFGLLDLVGRVERLAIEAPSSTLRLESALALASLNRERAVECFDSALREPGEQHESALLTLLLLQNEGVDLVRSTRLNSSGLRWQISWLRLRRNRAQRNIMTLYAAFGGAIGAGIGGFAGAILSAEMRAALPFVTILASAIGGVIGGGVGLGLGTVEAMDERHNSLVRVAGAALGGGIAGMLTGLLGNVDKQPLYALLGAAVGLAGGMTSGGNVAIIINLTAGIVAPARRLAMRLAFGLIASTIPGSVFALGVHLDVLVPGLLYGFGLGLLTPGIVGGLEFAERGLKQTRPPDETLDKRDRENQ